MADYVIVETMTEIDSDLSRREILAVLRNGPESNVGDWNQSAYDVTVNRWASARADDMERLENSEAFEWVNAGWEFAGTGPQEPSYLPTDFNLISGVDHDVADSQLADLAYEFVADWISTLTMIVKKKQATSSLTEREFVVYMLFADLDEQYVSKALTKLTGTNQSVGAIRSYKARAKNKMIDAKATLALEYDDMEVDG